MSEQQAILRAVEVSTADTFIINATGTANDETITPTQTLFPNVLALWSDICEQMTGYIGMFNAEAVLPDAATNRFRCTVYTNATGVEMTSIGGTLASTFGFTGSETVLANALIESTYTPKYMWLPTYVTSDQGWFMSEAEELFKFARGADGNLSGVGYSGRAKRKLAWPCESATNAIYQANSATAFQADRCFRKVIDDARAMVCNAAGSGNKYCKGVYWIPDVDALTSANNTKTALLPTTWNSGTLTGTYLFCSPGVPVIRGASTDNSRAYYDVDLELVSAVAPAWGWDITPS